jgi:hypothetical protein
MASEAGHNRLYKNKTIATTVTLKINLVTTIKKVYSAG